MPTSDPALPVPHRSRVAVLLTATSALSAISPLLALPLISRAAGPEGFLNIATGQAIGTLAATLILFGWNIRGPVQTARSSRPQDIFWASLFARGLNGAIVLPALAVVAVLATTEGQALLTVVAALAFAWQGFSIAWYAIGTGSPGVALVFDTLPRILGNIVGGVLAFALTMPLLYPAVLLGTSILALVTFALRNAHTASWSPVQAWHAAIGSYASQWRSATTGALLTFSETAPLTALGVAGSPAAVGFAPFDRVVKYGYIGVYMVSNAVQGWVSSAPGALGRQRMRRAVGLHGMLATALGLGFALLAPPLVPIILGPDFRLGTATAVFGGVALAAMTMTTVFGLCVLMPSGRENAYLRSVVVGAVIVLPAVLLGAAWWGVTGAAAGVAVVQCAVLATMTPPAIAALRRA